MAVIYSKKLPGVNSRSFSSYACHPCAGAMLIFSVSFQFYYMYRRSEYIYEVTFLHYIVTQILIHVCPILVSESTKHNFIFMTFQVLYFKIVINSMQNNFLNNFRWILIFQTLVYFRNFANIHLNMYTFDCLQHLLLIGHYITWIVIILRIILAHLFNYQSSLGKANAKNYTETQYTCQNNKTMFKQYYFKNDVQSIDGVIKNYNCGHCFLRPHNNYIILLL